MRTAGKGGRNHVLASLPLRMRFVAGAVIILHGLVHFMYVGHALRWFELREGMVWPIGARFFPIEISDAKLRSFVAITIGITSIGLIAGGVGMLLDTGWAAWVTIASAILASLLHILLWNGDAKTAADQGLYGVIINLIIVVWILAAG